MERWMMAASPVRRSDAVPEPHAQRSWRRPRLLVAAPSLSALVLVAAISSGLALAAGGFATTASAGAFSARLRHEAAGGVLAPRKRKRPVILGTPRDGQLSSATQGRWRGTPPFTFSYQWQLCKKKGCSPIAGATEAAFRPDTAEIGRSLEVIVTASNPSGKATAISKRTRLVAPGPPVSLAPPTISGTPLPDQKLEASPGTWAGTAPFAYEYQWSSCNVMGECLPIAGATASTYTVAPPEVASALEVQVTAVNAAGSATATSEMTGAVGALPPTNTVAPSILGLLTDGQLLSALEGSWEGTGPLSFAFQWQLCNAAGSECNNISEALASTLSLISTDVGKTLRIAVTATNQAGSSTATSAATHPVAALLPANTELPSITGSLTDGQLLKALTGSWTGTTPLTYTYQWQLCNATGSECNNISEALASTLSLISTDVGKTLRIAVTATNQAGSTTATSQATNPIAALLPANTELPTISGLLKVGQILSASTGSWSGTTPIKYSYQWQNCGLLGTSCANISKAVESVLKLELEDVGLTFRIVVTATNVGGSTSADSAVTSAILGLL
jgi:uncharacterized protein YukE